MRILVTGHEGFEGRNMMAHLHAEEGWHVDGYSWKLNSLPDVTAYDWVIHLDSDMSDKDVDTCISRNLEFSQWLFNECNLHGVNLQYASTCKIYGNNKDFSEHASCHPQTPYAWSKYLFERYVREHPAGAVVQGFRYFNVYGPEGEEHKGDQASPYYKFTRQAKTNGIIKVFDNSSNYYRDFIQVSKVVDTHLKFLNITESGLWNLGTGNPKSFLEIACEIGKKYPSVVEQIAMPDNLKDSYQKYTCADMNHLNNTLRN